jgi:hypothetical protein
VEFRADTTVPASPATLFGWVEDLTRYPAWLSLLQRVQPDGTDDAWVVDLRARVGPLARSKRLRMVRTVHDPERVAVFERVERDGRAHSTWILRAEVSPAGPGARLDMTLTYGGSLWGPMLERILRDEVTGATERLRALIS